MPFRVLHPWRAKGARHKLHQNPAAVSNQGCESKNKTKAT
jgi:hypothetical protein